MTKIYAEISIGELIDKITILEIKQSFVQGKAKINVIRELKTLQKQLDHLGFTIDPNLFSSLAEINKKLWYIEDKIRKKEDGKEFDSAFIELARSVYMNNDERARIKKHINQLYNSSIVEEKSYRSKQ